MQDPRERGERSTHSSLGALAASAALDASDRWILGAYRETRRIDNNEYDDNSFILRLLVDESRLKDWRLFGAQTRVARDYRKMGSILLKSITIHKMICADICV